MIANFTKYQGWFYYLLIDSRLELFEKRNKIVTLAIPPNLSTATIKSILTQHWKKLTSLVIDMAQTLLGKTAIVTGGSRGLGAAIALDLAQRGANILITYNSASVPAQEVVSQIKRMGRDAIAVQALGDDRKATQSVVDTVVKQWGEIDIIVNNAGYGEDYLIDDLTYEDWDKTMAVNVRFPVFLIQTAIPYFGPAPRIVNISSVAARNGLPGMVAYSASKAALESITRILAQELGQRCNATINCVNPGPISTDMWNLQTSKEVKDAAEAFLRTTPAAPRIAETSDITPIVGFLCEEQSRWSTGSVVNANGGNLFV